MSKWVMKRRELLKSMGAGALLLHPLFRSQLGLAQGVIPKRCIFLFSPNGSIYNEWQPNADFTFKQILKPLEVHRDHVVVLDGLANRTGGAGDPHRSIGTLLSASPLQNDSNTGYSTGISLDQYLADQLAGQTPFRSMELGVGIKVIGDFPNRRTMSTRTPGKPIFPNQNPQQVFDLIFGGFAAPTDNTAELQKIREQKASVLDFVSGELTTLRARVSKDERAKLDEHLDTVRSIEQTLQQPIDGTACTVPTDPTNWSQDQLTAEANYASITKTQIDMMVEAMACDLTRIGSLVWNGGSGLMKFGFVPGVSNTESHHGYSHGSGPDPVGNLVRINNWYAQQVAYLVNKLKSKREGGIGQTMLDNTLIFWVNEITAKQPNAHAMEFLPLVLIGNLNGYFKTRQHLKFDGKQAHAAVLVDICNAMGHNVNSFGSGQAAPGRLPGLKRTA